MPRSLYEEGLRHPLNPANSEFLHSLGRFQPVHARACARPLFGDLTLSVESDLD